MKKNELKAMSVEDLKKHLENIEKEMINLSETDRVKMRKLKKEKARVITLIHQKSSEGYAS